MAQLANYEKDKASLAGAKARIIVFEETIARLEWEREVLEQRFAKVRACAYRGFPCCCCHDLRAAPLVRAKGTITVKNAVCPSLPFAAYGVFECEFGFPSHEWSCSNGGEAKS